MSESDALFCTTCICIQHACTLTARPHGGVRWSFNASSHSLWMGWRHALPNCIVVPSLHFAHVARFKSRAMFYFWSFDGSVSQSNHMPVQALANQTASLCAEAGDSCDWLLVEFQTRPPASFNARRRVDAALLCELFCMNLNKSCNGGISNVSYNSLIDSHFLATASISLVH